jgi:asparagine synthase (glutamine-hydrolysing)
LSGLLVALDHLDEALAVRMLAEVEVLGGDDRALWTETRGGVTLGRAFRRELGSAQEPAIVKHEACVVVLDGRLSGSANGDGAQADSLVVIDAYRRFGDDCVSHLDGEFTFALWDDRRRRLLCAADVLGRRTLAYHWDGRRFLASSRAIALLRHPRVPRQLDATYAACVLGDAAFPLDGATPLAGIRRLRPGRALAIEREMLREWTADSLRLRAAPPFSDVRAAAEEFWSLLDASTRERARGARRPAMSLSGGLDSACIASSLARVAEPKAYAILSGDRVDERRAVEAVLRRYPAELRAIPPDGSALTAHDGAGPALDDPFPMAMVFLPSRVRSWESMANDGVDLALDGEGGDELFELPMTLGELARRRAWTRSALYVARSNPRRGLVLRWLLLPRAGPLVRRAWVARRHASMSQPWLTRSFVRTVSSSRARELETRALTSSSFAEAVPAVLESAPGAAFRVAARLLASASRLSWASPFFDRRLAELASRVPSSAYSPVHDKMFLRLAAAGRLPEEVRWRPKRERLYDDLMARALSASALPPSVGATIRAWIDPARLRNGLPVRNPPGAGQHHLHAAICFVRWVARIERDYCALTI